MKGKFFRGILRQLSVLLKNNFKKKKVKDLKSLKSLTFFSTKYMKSRHSFLWKWLVFSLLVLQQRENKIMGVLMWMFFPITHKELLNKTNEEKTVIRFFLFRATLRETEFESLDFKDLNLISTFVPLKFRWEKPYNSVFLTLNNLQKKFWNISWHPKSLLIFCLANVPLIFCQFQRFENFIKPWVFF